MIQQTISAYLSLVVDWLGLSGVTIDWAVLSEPEMIARLVLQVLLFAASATFSMSETALFSLRETDLEKLEDMNRAQASRIRALLAEPRRLIVSILCGNELINIAATINLAGIFLALFGNPEAAGIANTLIMLPLLLIFGEIVPKTVAVTQPLALSRNIVEPVQSIWVRLVAPLRFFVRLIADRITTALIGAPTNDRNILAPDEFRTFLREVEKDGVVSTAERRLISNLIYASMTPITDIMVPRPQVAFIDADLPITQIVERFRRLRHRRVPLYRGHRDTIVGVIREEKVIAAIGQKPVAEITLGEIVGPATFVPVTVTVAELAEFFKNGDHHAAILVNEFGGVEGLVSADDVFGYLTHGRGVYLDSCDGLSEPEPGAHICEGLMPLRTLAKATGISLSADTAMATVGGHIMARLGRLPKPGDEVEDGGIVLRVLAIDNLLITRVLVAPGGHSALSLGTEPRVPARDDQPVTLEAGL